MDRPEQAEWTETAEGPAEESADAASEEKSPDPASQGDGSIAHRLNRVTRYASAAGNPDSPEPAPASDAMAQPVAASAEPAAHDPAPAETPLEPAPLQEEPLTAAPAAATPPAAAAEEPPQHAAAPSVEAQPRVPAAEDPPEPAPPHHDAAAEQAPEPPAPESQAPVEAMTEASGPMAEGSEPVAQVSASMAEALPAAEPGPVTDEPAAPTPMAPAPPSEVAAPNGPAAPAAVQASPQPAAVQAPPDTPSAGPSDATVDTTAPAAAGGEVLTVGRGIRLVAKLCECAELMVEGHLEATARARHLMVAQGGRFIGSAEVDTAEIHGHFEGNLTVANRLLIPASGSVAGTTCYQEIVIEAGGRIMGNTQRLSEPAETGDSAA